MCCGSGVDAPFLIWSVHDQLTDHAGENQCSFYGVQLNSENQIIEILPDWKLLLRLNDLKITSQEQGKKVLLDVDILQTEIESQISEFLKEEDFKPIRPIFILEGILLP